MKTISLLFLLVLALALTGCRDHPAKPAAGVAKHKADGGIAFKPKEGLSVPEDVARHIGLQLADVTERKVSRQLVFTAQVYGEAGPQIRRVTLASAWVDPALTNSLAQGTDLVATTADTNSRAGVITRLVPAANPNSPTEVLLELRADQGELKVGDFVRVTVAIAGKADVTVVPRAALLRNTEGHFVYVVNGSRLLRAAVQVGGEQDGLVEIKDGLLAGDRIAVAGVPMLWCAELHRVNGGDACTGNH